MDESIRAAASNYHVDVEVWRTFFAERVKSHRALVEGYLVFLEEMASSNLPPIFEGRHLALLLGLKPTELARYTFDPDSCYRSFHIPKKAGGSREVSVPWLKLLLSQQWLDWNIFRKLPVHSAAHGFVRGRSNITNAKAHLGAKRIMTVDIKDFFGSIGSSKVLDILISAKYPPNVAYLISRLCCRFGALPQGGAASPQLSNLAMFETDVAIAQLCEERGLIYTRYVDDITISGKELKPGFDEEISDCLSFVGLRLNPEKTRYQFGQRKIVTGIAIGSGKAKLPRAMKRQYKNEAFITRMRLSGEFNNERKHDYLLHDRCIGKLAYWCQVEGEDSRGGVLLSELRELVKERLGEHTTGS